VINSDLVQNKNDGYHQNYTGNNAHYQNPQWHAGRRLSSNQLHTCLQYTPKLAFNQSASINKSKLIFQVITENYSVINAIALEMRYQRSITLVKTGGLNKNTQILIHQKKGKKN